VVEAVRSSDDVAVGVEGDGRRLGHARAGSGGRGDPPLRPTAPNG
jgi:hypothetical protein